MLISSIDPNNFTQFDNYFLIIQDINTSTRDGGVWLYLNSKLKS